MPSCLVVGDAIVQFILQDLGKQEVQQWQRELEQALKLFSHDERKLQPEPSVINRDTGQRTLFRPFTSPDSVGIKIIVDPAPVKNESGELRRPPLHGILTICDDQGLPRGLINAEAVTGFRTALSALIPLQWRQRIGKILVFGAGTQALWHIRLTLKLRGAEVESICIVNRSVDRSRKLAEQIAAEKEHATVQLHVLDPSADADKSALLQQLSSADVIYCTVPTEEPLFTMMDLLSQRTSPPLITAVGSWQASMIELEPALLQHVAAEHAPGHAQEVSKGRIIVDDATSALQHAGEVVQSGLKPEQLVEIGEVVGLVEQDAAMLKWLQEGLVIYKSIGVSLTDLVAGNAILAKARNAKLGVLVDDF